MGSGRGHLSFVGDVAREHRVPALVGADQIFEAREDRDGVLGGVDPDRGGGERVDVRGLDGGGAGERGGDRDETRARGEIEHMSFPHQRRVVEDVARERLPARPGESPEWRRQPHGAELLFRFGPDRHRFVREPEFDLGDERRRRQPCIGEDEGALRKTLIRRFAPPSPAGGRRRSRAPGHVFQRRVETRVKSRRAVP